MKQCNLYTFDELSEKAKNRARKDYIEKYYIRCNIEGHLLERSRGERTRAAELAIDTKLQTLLSRTIDFFNIEQGAMDEDIKRMGDLYFIDGTIAPLSLHKDQNEPRISD